jgi:hypothetical protein
MTKTKIDWNEAKNAVFEMEDGDAFVIRMFPDRIQVLYSKTMTVEPHPTVAGAVEVGFDELMGQWCAMAMNRLFFDDFAADVKMGYGKRDVLHVIDKALRQPDGRLIRGTVRFSALKPLIEAIAAKGEADGTMSKLAA